MTTVTVRDKETDTMSDIEVFENADDLNSDAEWQTYIQVTTPEGGLTISCDAIIEIK